MELATAAAQNWGLNKNKNKNKKERLYSEYELINWIKMYTVKVKNPTKKLKIKGECDTQEKKSQVPLKQEE
jgi:hypothetical protein